MRLSLISLKITEQAMNIYSGLLFQQGYIQDAQLALSLAGADEGEKPASDRQPASPVRPQRSERRASFRRGAIFSICSTALSPFR